MKASTRKNFDAILRFPAATVLAAARNYGVAATDKIGAATTLAEMIDSGSVTITGIAACAATQTVVANMSLPGAESPAAAAVATKAHDTAVAAAADARNAMRAATLLQQKLSDLQSDAAATATAVEDLTVMVKRLPTAPAVDASAAVAKAVADAFKPFAAAVEAAGAQAAVATIAAHGPVGKDTVDNVFGIKVSVKHNVIDLYSHNDAPAIDNEFIWQENIIRHLLQCAATGENLWLGGEKGTGKTQTVQQFAARTGRSFTRINFHKYTTVEEYIGAVGLVNGATQFVEGPFLRAYTTPGAVILLDEISNCDPGELATLNGLLEPGAAVTIHGKVYRRAPGVLIFAADNTLGAGDASGRYAGVRQMNAALLDRFARAVPFTFLPRQVEVSALMNHTGCNQAVAGHVIDALAVCRAKVATGDLIDAPSLRQAVAFVRACEWHTVEDAWATTIAAKQPSEGMVALQAVYAANISPALISANI